MAKGKRRGNKQSRAESAGQALGYAIVESAQLMYQENTKNNFLVGLKYIIDQALQL